ncbi:MAG TPA: toll/interleukin-1 receptor domain-containing protein [Pyrinomonadaceae bacterium]|jgi:hypothetical protein
MSLPDGPFIFVSYARVDSDFVHPEIERLEGQGYKIWYDKGEIEPGLFWDGVIREAVEACACFVVFITEDSIDSENVRKEIEQALSAGKPFISIHWDKVELPPRFQEQMRSRQALERYSLLKHEYEEPLSRALSPYRRPAFETPAPLPEDTRPDALPKIVFFMLGLLATLFLLFAALLIVTPYFASTVPGDPLNNRLAGWLSGALFAVIACGSGGAAFAVHRVYLRGKNG